MTIADIRAAEQQCQASIRNRSPLTKQPIGCNLLNVTGKELVTLLEKNGWTVHHVRGSHHILRKGEKTVSVPVHSGRDIGKGLLNRILKEAGLK